MRIRSKIDAWLVAVLLSSIALLVAGLWMAHAQGGPLPLGLIAPILLLGAGLPLWVLVGTHYTFVDDELVVRSGPFRWRIALREVRSVAPTRSPLASPALSLARLCIEYGAGRSVMVSPVDKAAFLRELERRRC